MLAIHSLVGQVMYYFGPISHRRFHQQAGPTCCVRWSLRQFIGLICQEALIGCSMSLDPYSIAFSRKYNSYVLSSDSYTRILVTYNNIRWSSSYDGPVNLFELNSNKATGQFRKCSIDSILRVDRTFSELSRDLYWVPRWYNALLSHVQTHNVNPYSCSSTLSRRQTTPFFSLMYCTRLYQASLQSWSCMS